MDRLLYTDSRFGRGSVSLVYDSSTTEYTEYIHISAEVDMVVVLTPGSGDTVNLLTMGPYYIDNVTTFASLILRLPPCTDGLLEVGFRNPVTSLSVQDNAGDVVLGAPTSAYGPGAALQFRCVGVWTYWK